MIRQQQGFTLLEVMLAFALLAAAMGLLIGMLSGGLQQVRQAQDETGAALFAQSLLDPIGILDAIEPGLRQGQSDDGRYQYQMQIRAVEDPAPRAVLPVPVVPLQNANTPRLLEISLRVRWGEQRTQQLQLTTMRARLVPLTAAP